MTSLEIRALIEEIGTGDTLTKKVQNVADAVGCNPSTIWNYLAKGSPNSNSIVEKSLQRLKADKS